VNRSNHYSVYLSDKDAVELIDAQQNKSEYVSMILGKVARGELVPPGDAKQRKLEAEAELAEKKAAAYDTTTKLKQESLRVDIDLKLAQSSLTGVEIQRRLNSAPTYHKRYILPAPDGSGLDYFCPICFRLIDRAKKAYDIDDYTQTKIAIVKHAHDEHGADPVRFDHAFPSYRQFERLFYGQEVKATASPRELALAFGEDPDKT